LSEPLPAPAFPAEGGELVQQIPQGPSSMRLAAQERRLPGIQV
jgi:hypothetical protein